MSPSRYDDVLSLRVMPDPQRRGYMFEQAIREILPWEHRPPIAMTSASEQFDAFFVWNSWHFLVECKAVERAVTAGSREWEDFELKVRKRQRGCYGLYCSLFDVDDSAVKQAVALNKDGYTVIVLSGDFWDQLRAGSLPLEDVLRYMVCYAKVSAVARPPAFPDISRWCYDKTALHKTVVEACHRYSALFLRRHRHPRHTDLYIPRGIDQTLEQMGSVLQPSRLALTEKTRRKRLGGKARLRKKQPVKEIEFTTGRSRPSQIAVFRDASGSGKTTAAVQVGLTTEPFFGAARAALENDLDAFDTQLLSSLSHRDRGLTALCELDQPVIVAIDSLDEASGIPQKNSQIVAMLRLLEELNAFARRERDLLAFPIGFMFTVRDDYWDRWHAVFEGRNIQDVRKEYSVFTAEELTLALKTYAAVFHFTIESHLTPEVRHVLSVPFYLQVFSEANEFGGTVTGVDDVFGESVLQLYFALKRESTLKRYIPNLTPQLVMLILAALAARTAAKPDLRLSWFEAADVVVHTIPLIKGYEDEVLRALASEQIISRDGDASTRIRFRHLQFVEYLMAYRMASTIQTGDADSIARVADDVVRVPLLSSYRIHSFLRFILKRELPHLLDALERFYAGSTGFVESVMPFLRLSLAHGELTSAEDMILVLKASASGMARATWDAFFIIAAKANNQPREIIVNAFESAWNANKDHVDRWKLLEKMADRKLLLQETVVRSAISSAKPRDWEVFLGRSLVSAERPGFKDMWRAVVGQEELFDSSVPAWQHSKHLLMTLLHDLEYQPGTVA